MPGRAAVHRDLDTPTTPPPVSVAVPVMVTGLPAVDSRAGRRRGDRRGRGVVSVEAVAATRPDCSVAGCTPMSANRLTVACCMRDIGAALPAVVVAVQAPRPLDRAGAEDERAAAGAGTASGVCVAVPGP